MESQAQQPYWSERHGRGPKSVPLDFNQLKRLFFNVLDDLAERGFFQEAFGYDCVDAGEVPGLTGWDPNAWFMRTLHREQIWPYRKYGGEWDEDTMFDVVEVLHDLCSKGTGGRYHGFNDCGWHYDQFDGEAGRNEYRQMLNSVLARYERPLELNAGGRLLEATPDEFRPLIEAEIPPGTSEDLVATRISDAVDLFRSRNASRGDRRRAVRELADVLEVLRPRIKDEALPKDERELFRIANEFSIRHNNRKQRGQYDDVIWLRWIFYVYLATIHTILRLQARETQQRHT